MVDARTLSRAIAYARSGAVQHRATGDDNARLDGVVQGTAPQPYTTSVRLIRSANGRLASFEGSCSCPVGYDCKHAVALVLAGYLNPRRPPLRGDVRARRGPLSTAPRDAVENWESTLGDLVAEPTHARTAAGIGLLFEWVNEPKRPGQRADPAAPAVRIRPITPSRSGNWTTGGLSWAKLEYFGYSALATSVHPPALTLVKELLALSRLSGRRSYYGQNIDVWLQDINSHRLWDVLDEARELGIALLSSTRGAQPLVVMDEPVTTVIDVTRDLDGLTIAPHLEVQGATVALDGALLIGEPPHGVAWHAESTHGTSSPMLCLAPLAAPLDGPLRRLYERGPVLVPARDESRFLHEVYPLLPSRLAAHSSDESVALPPRTSPRLLLTLSYRDARLSLTWARGLAGSTWRSDLHGAREHDEIEERASELLAAIPHLVEVTAWGPRLVAHAELVDLDAAYFVNELMTRLEELEGVDIEVLDELPRFHEVFDVPVIALDGTASRDGDWFDLSIEVSVAGEEVSFRDLFVALAEERSHLVLPSGTYFSLDSDELRQLATLILEARELHDAPVDAIRVGRYQTTLWDELTQLGTVAGQAAAWTNSVRALLNAAHHDQYRAPATLQATLRPYQLTGFNWLAFLFEHGLGGILADDMGLGKTLQALALICHTTHEGTSTAPYLVIAPTSVVENWANECHRFSPHLSVVTISETARRRSIALAELIEGRDVVVTSYALFRLEYEDYAAAAWSGVFLDEAQFVKNRHAKTHQLIKSLEVPFKVAITGTPMENTLMELWALLSLTAPGLFTSAERFEKHYRTPIERHHDNERLDQLRRRLRPVMLRRSKEQVATDLPAKQEQVLELELNTRHQQIYQKYLARERQKVLGLLDNVAKHRFEILRSLTLLRQASLDVSLIDPAHEHVHSTKLDALMDMVGDIVADGHRVLVFSQFTRFLSRARTRIEAAGIDYCYLDGRTRKRDTVINRFRTGSAPVFFISLKAGGFGLNLSEADYCILLDPWWNPATESQAVDRVHRIGQTRTVMVYRLVAKNTIEQKVMALKATKSALFSSVIDAGGFESGVLSAEDIRELMA